MVLCVRMDLKMTPGKIAAQCCHATLGVYKYTMRHCKENAKVWEKTGQAKITLKIPDEQAILELAEQAKQAKLPHYTVIDAGRTQIESGSRTVLAIGPAPIDEVDKLTKKFKLY